MRVKEIPLSFILIYNPLLCFNCSLFQMLKYGVIGKKDYKNFPFLLSSAILHLPMDINIPSTLPENPDPSLPPPDPIASLAQARFALTHLYPIQRYTIANILDGINQIVVLPTGSGKSLCFQLPSLLLPGITLIILPLLSLMEDQVRRLTELNIPCGCIKGSQTSTDREKLLTTIVAGEIKVVFITPESLESPKLDSFFRQVDVSHFVIDEAHCITEWGDSFRPGYLKIGSFIKKYPPGVITAFTATASAEVIDKIKVNLFDDIPVSEVIENPDRPNIHYSVIPVLSKSRGVTVLLESVERPVIVYTRSRKRTEYYARLARERLKTDQVFFYHAGLTKEERKDVERWFMKSEDGILMATSAFGMGIDKGNVRTIIHADIPYSIEAYLQESGRAGRDKKQSRAILLHGDEDSFFARKLDAEIGRPRFNALLLFVRNLSGCRRKHLLSLMDYESGGSCPGCDYCDGTAVVKGEGKAEVLDFIQKHKRRFTKRELIQLLHGKTTYDVIQKNLDRRKGFGLLHDWHREDIEEALDNVLEAGIIAIPRRGFWKNRVTIKKKSGKTSFN
ncbi:MAG: RecQ family ATP-dependent DNA helicase [Spirochaetales bacterium]|nr:RecQ family ATP-dependent DNA helicase [Spirochaetales bacterium]